MDTSIETDYFLYQIYNSYDKYSITEVNELLTTMKQSVWPNEIDPADLIDTRTLDQNFLKNLMRLINSSN